MDMNVSFHHPIASSAEAIWDMEEKNEYTKDVWCQYKYMVDYIDLINYCNMHTFDDYIQTKQAMAYLGCAMASLAYINPYQTRDLSYYLHSVVQNLNSKYMIDNFNSFSSDNMTLIQKAFNAGLYHMISGRDMHNGDFHTYAKAIYRKILSNRESVQEMAAIDTVRSRFEVFPNIMALMALEMHDKQFGTNYSEIKGEVLDCLKEKLRDENTGLFYESYQTGFIGYEGEVINPKSTWSTKILKPAVNAMIIAFYNYFEPGEAQEMWKEYKNRFAGYLLQIKAEDVADKVGLSLHTQLAGESEELFTALLAAKEMNDKEFFDEIQKHVFKLGEPTTSEGLVFFNKFGASQHLMGFFILFARVHVGWNKLFEHKWEKYYDFDYKKAR